MLTSTETNVSIQSHYISISFAIIGALKYIPNRSVVPSRIYIFFKKVHHETPPLHYPVHMIYEIK